MDQDQLSTVDNDFILFDTRTIISIPPLGASGPLRDDLVQRKVF